jgi:subtilase family serine protease
VYQRDLTITGISVLNHGCSIYRNDIDINGTSYYYPVEVNVQNTGTFDSGQFHVKLEVYLGASLETFTEILVADLAHGSSVVVNFTSTLRPASTGTYHLVATVDNQNEVVEDNESNNIYTSSTFKATIIGDVNGDQKVNILDAVIMAQAWGATPTDPWWNIKGDINHDGTVDIYDATRLSLHWAEFW